MRDHYYEPQFDMREIKYPFPVVRNLPGISWNVREQLEILEQLTFADELTDIPSAKEKEMEFYFNNGSFESGDAEYWYQLIRLKKPRCIIEIGAGNSTLIGLRATHKNKADNSGYNCSYYCIEPYEMPWLEMTEATILRKKAEDVEISFFSKLGENDILFIDSSHIIRPDGDVLFEYLELMPQLENGVIVHIHDVFSPRNYLPGWLKSEVRFWNEQYLLEAFLSHNDRWKIIGSLNYLHHAHYEKLKSTCPYLTPDREPGSFYIQKIV